MKTISIFCISLAVLFACSCNNSKSNADGSAKGNGADSLGAAPTSMSPATPTAESFDDARVQKLNIRKIDSVYQMGINTIDSDKAALKGHLKEAMQATQKMTFDFGQYLKKDTAIKSKGLVFYGRIYFRTNGTIDYFLYSRINNLNPDEQGEFKIALNKFIQTYKFPVTSKVPFVISHPFNM
jgi:hypothetical protein